MSESVAVRKKERKGAGREGVSASRYGSLYAHALRAATAS